MQYLDGSTLQEKLDRTGLLPLKEVLRIGMQVAGGPVRWTSAPARAKKSRTWGQAAGILGGDSGVCTRASRPPIRRPPIRAWPSRILPSTDSGVERQGWSESMPFSETTMNEVTRILAAVEQGDPRAANQLLPLVYEELRQLAAQKLAHEKPGQTLSATALVHEAYLRLVGPGEESRWNSRGHFFAAAAEAMRRILINRARDKMRQQARRRLEPH